LIEIIYNHVLSIAENKLKKDENNFRIILSRFDAVVLMR
jgi:hypothetical protein